MSKREPLTDKCIVLDLDETLICTLDLYSDLQRLEIMNDPKLLSVRQRLYILRLLDVDTKRGKGEKQSMWGIERPYLDDFLEFCGIYFNKVIIWTAGVQNYADLICQHIFKNQNYWPDLIYSRDDCVEVEIDGKKMRTKPLEKLYNEPKLKGAATPQNTLAIDNNDETFQQNLENAVHIPDFDPKLELEKNQKLSKKDLLLDDVCLVQLEQWLISKKVIIAKDVRTLDKSKIFTEDLKANPMEESNDEEDSVKSTEDSMDIEVGKSQDEESSEFEPMKYSNEISVGA